MRNREIAANCAREACTMAGLKVLNDEAVQLAATIRKNFEELGI